MQLNPSISLRIKNLSATAVCLTILAGCGDMTGLGGKSEYACKAPEGVRCNSVSGNYYNSFPSGGGAAATGVPTKGTPRTAPRSMYTMLKAASSGSAMQGSPVFEPAALRSPPRVMRLWIKPWEDSDHDLHDQSFVYLQTDSGRWQIAHAQRQIRDAFAPLKPPAPQQASSSGTASPSGQANSGAETRPTLPPAGALADPPIGTVTTVPEGAPAPASATSQ
ncbi:TraV family lipoprotein [Janthinobacterium lividum]|uniref:TraV family lipoprotein n=1 Tax=Janthinobacterium lividum TaxID=29581 RepID=UPI0008744E45|nr:TraV family lipoprotein [Janthinobacterium lividum]MCC7716944.1 TraV family lipoprotein [Janthinobacterium lividum]OEZ53491.1 type IV conjugative transfer system lipoprotein (TraV) [Janthinobacterium lividum]WQE31892.1 TraV family lipoprotein [Janthinobacterium lividum]STS86158.1 type IV conjugative transfer system protein TraV [Janthinobacterium lividum]